MRFTRDLQIRPKYRTSMFSKTMKYLISDDFYLRIMRKEAKLLRDQHKFSIHLPVIIIIKKKFKLDKDLNAIPEEWHGGSEFQLKSAFFARHQVQALDDHSSH